MKRRNFISSVLGADLALMSRPAFAQSSLETHSTNSSRKPTGRLARSYRILWDQNHGQEGFYNPPITPETEAQAHLGFFEGTPVDAYVCALGPDCGYTVAYPTKVKGVDFIVDRLNQGAKV